MRSTWWRLLPYAVFVQQREHDGAFIFARISERRALAEYIGESATQGMVGGVVYADDGPMARCGARLLASFQQVLETNEPVLEQVRASFRLKGGESEWLSYRRLLLPVWRPGNRREIACVVHRPRGTGSFQDINHASAADISFEGSDRLYSLAARP